LNVIRKHCQWIFLLEVSSLKMLLLDFNKLLFEKK
jgi:hypothetical protein